MIFLILFSSFVSADNISIQEHTPGISDFTIDFDIDRPFIVSIENNRNRAYDWLWIVVGSEETKTHIFDRPQEVQFRWNIPKNTNPNIYNATINAKSIDSVIYKSQSIDLIVNVREYSTIKEFMNRDIDFLNITIGFFLSILFLIVLIILMIIVFIKFIKGLGDKY